MTDRELMQDALEAMEAAIKSGDWQVDGSCDPDTVLRRLRDRLAQPEYEFECPRCGHCCQQREWVGLTDQEKENFENTWDVGPLQVEAIEAKLKEKNT